MRSPVVDVPGWGPIAGPPRPGANAHVRLTGVRAARDYGSYDDAALAALIAARDPAALEEMYDRHGPAVYRFARRVVVDEQLAQDVAQEVFLTIWRGAAAYDGSRGPLRAWLFSLTHHKAVDAVRGAQRHGSRRAPEEALESTPDLALSVEEHTVQAAEGARVHRALKALPEPQRKALLLAYFGGYSQSEIAALTGTPLGTVKTRTLAALRGLRALLADPDRVSVSEPQSNDQERVWPR